MLLILILRSLVRESVSKLIRSRIKDHEQEWDALDHFIARSGLDVEVALETEALADREIARFLAHHTEGPPARHFAGADPARSERVRDV